MHYQAQHEGCLYLFAQKWRLSGGILAGVAADLTPAEAKSKENDGGGRDWRRTDELGHEFLRLVQLSQEHVEAEAWRTEGGSQQREAFVVADPPLRQGLSQGERRKVKALPECTRTLECSAGGTLSSRPVVRPLKNVCVALWDAQMVPS